MRDEDIHIGDVLYIKEWDELIKEGHLNSDGNIEFTFDSTEHTRREQIIGVSGVILRKNLFIDKCGSQFTVKMRHTRPFGILYESEEDSERGAFAIWLTSNPPRIEEVATDDEIRLLLS